MHITCAPGQVWCCSRGWAGAGCGAAPVPALGPLCDLCDRKRLPNADKSKLMMLAGARSESPTLSPASVKLKAQMFGLLNPHAEQQEVKSWDQTTNRPFMNMLDVCPVTVHPGPLTFIINLIALTLHWIVLLLPLLSCCPVFVFGPLLWCVLPSSAGNPLKNTSNL